MIRWTQKIAEIILILEQIYIYNVNNCNILIYTYIFICSLCNLHLHFKKTNNAKYVANSFLFNNTIKTVSN